jgi:nicotinamidase/pyrazinamidase
MSTAIIVADVQNDFCEGGSLEVPGGADVAARISDLLGSADYDYVAATRDHHVNPGGHFSDRPDYIDSWPPHCVVGTGGLELHPNLDQSRIQAIFDKGEYRAAYSGFEGLSAGTPLREWLRERGVDTVDVVGIATDHCVRATALDAAANGFTTTVRLDLTAGVARSTVENALLQLRVAGVRLLGEPVVHSGR